MATLLFTVGGEKFYDSDFDPYTYVATFRRFILALQREVKNAYAGTSATSMAVGSGTPKTFTLLNADGVPPSGMRGLPRIYVRDAADPAVNYMVGPMTSFDATTGLVGFLPDTHAGSGTKTSWLVTFAGENGAAVGATNTPSYLVLAADGGLVNERVWTPGAGLAADDAGAGGAYTARTKTEPVPVTGTTHTQLSSNNQKHHRFTNALGCAVTGLRAASSAGCPIGALIGISAEGGAVTFTPSTGTVNGAASFLFPSGSTGFLVSDGADDWRAVVTHIAARVIEVTASTLTIDRTHNGALIVLNRSGGVAVTLAQTNDLGIGADFEIEFQASVGNHSITTAGAPQNVLDKSGGATVLPLVEGQGVKLRSNGGAGTAGIWHTLRGMADLGVQQVIGLVGQNNSSTPNTQFDLDCDAVVLRSAANGATVRFDPGAALTCNIATAGPAANGRDQAGAFSNASWLHFYWIWNGSTLATIASTVAPPTGPTLPTGYTHWAYAGAVYLDGSGNLKRTRLRGAWAYYEAGQVTSLNATTPSTTEQTIGVSALVPPNALAMQLDAQVGLTSGAGGGANHIINFRAVSGSNARAMLCVGIVSNSVSANKDFELPNIGQQFFYQATNNANVGSEALTVNVCGYKLGNGGE